MGNHETQNMVVVSTAMIRQETAEWLNRQGVIAATYHRTRIAPAVNVASHVNGWFLYVHDPEHLEDETLGISDVVGHDLTIILTWAASLGAHWINFDQDADVIHGLPTYEW